MTDAMSALEGKKLVPPPYASVRKALRLEECQFYHTIELPEVGLVGGYEGGNWDLRPSIENMLGGIDFRGKRVLEIGPASGFLTFEMERRGASVVCVDIPEHHKYDVVPYPEIKDRWASAISDNWTAMTNAWWFAREKFKSNAMMLYAGAYELDNYDIGQFDISILSNMLLHNRDPLKIMQNCCQVTTGSIVVIDIVEHALKSSGLPLLKFVPDPVPAAPGQENYNQWWRLSSHFVVAVLAVMGFRKPPLVTRFLPTWNKIPIESFRVVASR